MVTISTAEEPGEVVPAGRGNGHWRSYDRTNGLSPGIVYSIAQDRKGNVWFGTGEGLCRFNGKDFTRFSEKDGLADSGVWSVFVDQDGDIWFGTKNGLNRFDGKKMQTYNVENGLVGNNVRSIFQDREGSI